MTRRPPTLGAALLPIAAMAGLFVLGALVLSPTAELLIVVLLGAAAVAGAVAVRQGCTFDDIQTATGAKVASVLPALLILLSIGMLIASWVISGTIPTLVYWGIRWVDPRFLVLTAFLTTALMSLFTGTSWGSAGTIGVALLGTAAALDAPLAATAGAVVSGAYFGDKMSPLSDSTNICAIGAGAPLYAHIRHMLYTAVPSFLVATVVYALVGRLGSAPSAMPDSARTLLADLDASFTLGAVALVPALIVVIGIVRRTPPVLAIAVSSAVAVLLAVGIQGVAVGDALTAVVSGVRLPMLTDSASAGDAFARLVERGGLYSMAPTLVVVLAAFLLAGAMDASGSLDLLVERLLGTVRSTFGLIAATMGAGATTIALTSHGGVTALIVGGLFQGAYRERALAPENLSRSLEDSVTITEPLMPWTVSAVFMATTLGVPTVAYAPWAVFCWLGPVFSLTWAGLWERTGFGLRRLPSSDPGGVALDTTVRPVLGSDACEPVPDSVASPSS
ncbi:MAG: Na+/H+ antiporter NhaC [Gemmatimonadetes bacterium]|nr:Na+/H+ antiporter NhaC [Gemmatimonadota bacterium]